MCGLIAVIKKDGSRAAKMVAKRYQEQKFRGINGFGYVAVKDNQIVSFQRTTTEKEILLLLAQETAPEIWFHHRTPTSTPNIKESAHPLLVEAPTLLDHQYLVLHNGVIRNTDDLYKQHTEKGFTYQTEITKTLVTKDGTHYPVDTIWNDSESLAIETALALDGKKGIIDTEGAAAVIGLQTKGKRVVGRFFYRNSSNPLYLYEDKMVVTLTSHKQGKEVEVHRVHGLTAKGEVTKIDPIIVSPPVWKYTGKSDYSEYNAWMDKNDVESSYAKRHIRHISNGPTNARHITELLPPPKKKTIEDMNSDQLWGEYDRMLGAIAQTEFDIQTIDDEVEIYGRVSATNLTRRENLQKKLEGQKVYLDEVETAIDEKNEVAKLNFS